MVAVFSIILFLVSLGYVLWPLRQERREWAGEVKILDKEKRVLDREKRVYLKALKDIEFEHASDKMNLHDFSSLSRHYQQKVVEILAKLEDLDDDDDEE